MIVGNWKMNTTVAEAVSLAKHIRGNSPHQPEGEPHQNQQSGKTAALDRTIDVLRNVITVICPPFISLVPVKEALEGSSICLGAQNFHFEEQGAYTGEISPRMLIGLCEYVFIGHSERRTQFGETDEIVGKKVRAAVRSGLKPILCIGEDLKGAELSRIKNYVGKQINTSLANVETIVDLTIIYEPVWAIGSGTPVDDEHAAQVIRFIRHHLGQLYSEHAAMECQIIVGGSITSDNIKNYMRHQEIDGAGVGAASLIPDHFLDIASEIAQFRPK